ncbi:hypothetical protein [Roseicella aerolata]|uniref:Uncharacterized protein n=1 Tax=Roseicella aerolata TaxID=2883479 RepID=A0A9X1ICT1_9PROT|nr:hypothetical protein [Roseicella aerolata]MCB4820963.1 hypothetical protein [Roseicella aerolata]
MIQAFRRHRPWCEDWAAIALALGYVGGFLAAMELALARLLFLAAF